MRVVLNFGPAFPKPERNPGRGLRRSSFGRGGQSVILPYLPQCEISPSFDAVRFKMKIVHVGTVKHCSIRTACKASRKPWFSWLILGTSANYVSEISQSIKSIMCG
jgi:hypothetical protein